MVLGLHKKRDPGMVNSDTALLLLFTFDQRAGGGSCLMAVGAVKWWRESWWAGGT